MSFLSKFKVQVYNVGFVTKAIDLVLKNGIQKGDIMWLKHKYKDRFFADPFLIKEDLNHYYVLCEEYKFVERTGKISLLVVDKERFELVEKKEVIKEQYHLSFPFCEFGKNYIIPESCKGDGTYKYIVNDNFEVVEKTKILDEGLIDAVFYFDNDGEEYILACRKNNPNSSLYIYNKKNGQYVLDSQSPILTDIRYSRSAGKFFCFGGDVFRPVQDSTGRYGWCTRIVKINNLNSKCYSFDEIQRVSSSQNPPYNETLHTFNVYGDVIVVDGNKDLLKPFVKIDSYFKNKRKK